MSHTNTERRPRKYREPMGPGRKALLIFVALAVVTSVAAFAPTPVQGPFQKAIGTAASGTVTWIRSIGQTPTPPPQSICGYGDYKKSELHLYATDPGVVQTAAFGPAATLSGATDAKKIASGLKQIHTRLCHDPYYAEDMYEALVGYLDDAPAGTYKEQADRFKTVGKYPSLWQTAVSVIWDDTLATVDQSTLKLSKMPKGSFTQLMVKKGTKYVLTQGLTKKETETIVFPLDSGKTTTLSLEYGFAPISDVPFKFIPFGPDAEPAACKQDPTRASYTGTPLCTEYKKAVKAKRAEKLFEQINGYPDPAYKPSPLLTPSATPTDTTTPTPSPTETTTSNN